MSYVKSKNKNPGDVKSLLVNGNIISDDLEKAELLNSYFVSVFCAEPDDGFFNNNICQTDVSIEDFDVKRIDILRNIEQMNMSKAAGPDDIHARVVIECRESFSDILYIIFCKSLSEGSLPIQWKQANVKALFKKGSRTDCSNYRPVSLTSIICKLFESLVRDNILQHLEMNCLLSKHQHGFRHGHSCLTQLIETMEDFNNYYDKNTPFDCIYLDFAKAFDRVPHNRLLTKIHNCGIRGNLFMWLKCFLSNRVQRVVCNGKFSNWSKVTSGIPQGSVLGPVLFSIFINDIPEGINSRIKLFADDTKIFNSACNHKLLQDDLIILSKWSDKWILPFNVEKCMVLHYGKKNENVGYKMNGKTISEDIIVKDLGVYFTNDLKFHHHICKITATANSRLGVIRNTFHRIEKVGFLDLYKCMVRPILEYCNSVWSPYLKKHHTMLEKIQRRATKMISGMETLSYSERLKVLQITTLYYRRQRQDMLQVYRIIEGIDCLEFDSFFQFNRSITRGSSKKLIKPRATSSYKLNSFSHRVINLWNELPEFVVQSKTINEFKSNLSIQWNNKAFKYEIDF